MSAEVFAATVWEDGHFTVLGRATARDATGAASPTATEGNLLKQADVSAVQVTVYDLGSTTPDTAIQTYTPAVSSVIYDTLQTSGVWGLVSGGGNFLFDVTDPLPSSDRVYRIEVKLTTTGSKVSFGVFELYSQKIAGS